MWGCTTSSRRRKTHKIDPPSWYSDYPLVFKAFSLALRYHAEQVRIGGEPYITHPMAVAEILRSWGMDETTMAAGLLHDVLEDTEISEEKLQEEVGGEILLLVKGVTKVSRPFLPKRERDLATYRNFFLSMAEDIRVVFIKLADRLHNMHSLHVLPSERQRRIAEETLGIYAPIAHRLGMWRVKAELEDLAFEVLYPREAKEIQETLLARKEEWENLMDTVGRAIRRLLSSHNIEGSVSWRFKNLYSIYQKIVTKEKDWTRLYDIMAFRIIVESEELCYQVLALLHDKWKGVPQRLKDYIQHPKVNGYQSIHTTLLTREEVPFEVQIRTKKMHQQAEWGLAAHFLYKEMKGGGVSSDKLDWLQRIKKALEDHVSLEEIKFSLFMDEIYVSTPRGEILAFPKGATCLDFAYRIHTEVGHHAVGADVNGKRVPLSSPMKTGDVVKIQTSPTQKPSREWLSYVVTPHAKQKIRRYLHRELREEAEETGKKKVLRLLSSFQLSQEEWEELLRQKGWENPADFYIEVGFGKLDATAYFHSILKKKERKKPVRKMGEAVSVGGETDLTIRLAKCCYPIPGDKIIAWSTRTRGITIHWVGCPQLPPLDHDSLFPAEWVSEPYGWYPSILWVEGQNYPGLQGLIVQKVEECGFSLEKVDFRIKKEILFGELIVKVQHTRDFLRIKNILESLPGVFSVGRKGRGSTRL